MLSGKTWDLKMILSCQEYLAFQQEKKAFYVARFSRQLLGSIYSRNLQSGNCQDIQIFDVVVLIVVLTSAVGDASKLYLIVLFTVAGQAPCSGT